MELPWNKIKEVGKSIAYISFIMLLGIVSFNTSIFLHDTGLKPRVVISNMLTDNVFRLHAIAGETDNISISIAKFCNTLPTQEQVPCVVKQTTYNYQDHNGTYSPDEFYNNGNNAGVCRDISIYYASIFKLMGWRIYYNLNTPQHVFIEVTKHYDNKDIRCTIDGVEYDCHQYDSLDQSIAT